MRVEIAWTDGGERVNEQQVMVIDRIYRSVTFLSHHHHEACVGVCVHVFYMCVTCVWHVFAVQPDS